MTDTIYTDLIGQVIQVHTPTNDNPEAFTFGRVRAVYVGKDGLRIVVLLTSGYLHDVTAHLTQIGKDA